MPTNQLLFFKLQGAGNDFVLLDLIANPLPLDFNFEAAAIRLCDRHFGVGADGLLVLEPSDSGASIRKRMWNPDGTEDMCGNGVRCLAALAWRQGHVQEPVFTMQTLAGQRRIEMINPNLIRANMGEPIFESAHVPIVLPPSTKVGIEWNISLPGRQFRACSLSTGSTHTVIFLNEVLSEREFQTYSPLIENHQAFPERTSIMWAVPDGFNRFKIRIWERGAGETLACGTGACAVGVAAQITGKAEARVEVESRGGTLLVEWKPDQEIFMTGPAHFVFEGVFELEI